MDSSNTPNPRAVGWLLSIVAIAAAVGAGFGIARLSDGAAGDPLAFFGALLGAATAVLGAEIVATRQRRIERAEARNYQYDLLRRIKESIEVVSAHFMPDPTDATEFNRTMLAIPEAISSMTRDSALLQSPDVQRSAGWNVAIGHVARLVEEAQPGLGRLRTEEISNGDQFALAVAMAQCISDLRPALRQVESCMIDLRPLSGPPRR